MQRCNCAALALVLIGCSASIEETDTANHAPIENRGATASRDVHLMLSVWTDDSEGNSRLKEYPEPSAADVKRILQSLDWTNEQQNPRVTLARSRQNAISLAGRPNAVAEDEGFVAQWSETDRSGTDHIWDTPPLDSVDTAVTLFLSFFNNDGKLRKLAKWIEL